MSLTVVQQIMLYGAGALGCLNHLDLDLFDETYCLDRLEVKKS
jgi:hypothetical protein